MADAPLAIGVASRPYPGEVVNGDAYAVHWSGSVCRLALIDGLGHGMAAAAASASAIKTLDAHPAADPVEALRRCHLALAGTRGAAMSVASLDLAKGELVYAGIGNVEGHLWKDGHRERLICYRGIVGSAMRTIRPFTVSLGDGWVLLLHSDGISARADLLSLGLPEPWTPEPLARAVLEQYGRQHDDALALVAMPRR